MVAGLGPSGRGGRRREKAGRARRRPGRAHRRLLLGWAKTEKINEIPFFLFLFPIFQSHFQEILKSILNLIQTTQYKISNAVA
jgi:hypothetical protein